MSPLTAPALERALERWPEPATDSPRQAAVPPGHHPRGRGSGFHRARVRRDVDRRHRRRRRLHRPRDLLTTSTPSTSCSPRSRPAERHRVRAGPGRGQRRRRPRVALDALVGCWIGHVFDNRNLIATYLERVQIPTEDLGVSAENERRTIDLWARTLRSLRPELTRRSPGASPRAQWLAYSVSISGQADTPALRARHVAMR